MNTQSQFEFFKDQVERLNGVLSFYQDIFLEKSQKSGSNELRMILNNHTAPLLAEYDRIIHELRSQVEQNKIFVDQEQIRVNSIIKENERLWRQVNEVSSSSGGVGFIPGESTRVYENMQHQLDCLSNEKRALEEIVHITEMEVSRLQADIGDHNLKPDTVIFNERIQEMKVRYQSSISDLEREVAQLRDMNRELSNESGRLRKQICEVEKDNTIVSEKLRFEREASEENCSQLKNALKRLEYMDKEKKQLMASLEEAKTSLRSHESTKNEFRTALDGLESRYHEKEQQVYDLTQKVKEAFQTAEEASSDRKMAEMRENQALTECDRLRGVITGILDDAGVRTREEVDIVRDQCDKEVERIMEELNLCEQNRQELLAEIDQLKRSKIQLEQEMEMFHRMERERSLQEMTSCEVSHERMMRAERERETLRLQHLSLDNQLDKEKSEKERLQENYVAEVTDLQKKVTLLQDTCDKAQANADRFAKLLNSSEESAGEARKKYQESLKKSRHEYEIMKQTFQMKQQEYEAKMQSTEEAQRTSSTEMRQMLHKQQQLSSKWKDEAHSLSNQYEERLAQMTKDLERQKTRNNELVTLLQDSKQQLLQSHELIEEKKQMINMLDNRVRILDNDEDLDQVNFVHNEVSSNDNNWQLKQIKKRQQKLIRESVARKYFSS